MQPPIVEGHPVFPPLLKGERVPVHGDHFVKAMTQAIAGIDSGTIYWSEDIETLKAAIVLAPETSLEEALQAYYVVQIGIAEALGALAPPEVPVQFVWPDRIKVNGAFCGRLRIAAETTAPDSHPNWLIIGFEIPFASTSTVDPGERPNETALYEEGCVEISPTGLLESWSRHTLVWLNRYLADGFTPVHEAWRGRCIGLGEQITYPREGLFTGVDDRGNMLLRDGAITTIISLSDYLESV